MSSGERLREFLRTWLPGLAGWVKKLSLWRHGRRDRETVFTWIYQERLWQEQESPSGPFADLAQTQAVTQALPALVRELGVRTLLDAACGDFHWMKEITLPVEQYIGVDIVADMLALNQQRYGNRQRRFIRADIRRDPLPQADLILCRDGFQVMPFKDIKATLSNFRRSGAAYLLATTFPALPVNLDNLPGNFRPLNLCRPPFNFPADRKSVV